MSPYFCRVGASVRDRLLGLPVPVPEYVVVGASAEALLAMGFETIPGAAPGFRRPGEAGVYRLACRRVQGTAGRPGLECGPEVSLGEDLKRRDLTLDAMAEDAAGEIVDPFGGEDDLREGVLRHATPDFALDAGNILKVAVYAARYYRWGFRVAHGTNALMRRMVRHGALAQLAREEPWASLRAALEGDRPDRFLHALGRCGALAGLMPEVQALAPGTGEAAHGTPADSGMDLDLLAEVAATTADAGCRLAVLAWLVDKAGGRAAVDAWLARVAVPGPEQVRLIRGLAQLSGAPEGIRGAALVARLGCAGPDSPQASGR
jgi:tRNA nucleotidyltransferase (CCA-adding enzyme)